MNKQNVIDTQSVELYSHKKQWDTDTCYNIDEPWKHYAKWNKPDTKGQLFYGSTYIKYLE